jgi:hypothetical protein
MTRKVLVVYKGQVDDHIVHPENGVGAWKLSQLTARATGNFRDRLRTAEHIANPKPFIWTKSAGEILEKVARAKQVFRVTTLGRRAQERRRSSIGPAIGPISLVPWPNAA